MDDPVTVATSPPARTVIGWREWIALPQLGIAAIRAKIDTGARSCALHVDALDEYHLGAAQWLRFTVATRRRTLVTCEAPALDRRPVTDSGGHTRERWFIGTAVQIAGLRFDAEINLTNRGNMLFPMLLGRRALSGRFLVDPSGAYLCGRRRRARAV
ncbi:MAG TPA: RimK/LysX family protein [Rudaea sp.]